jgi:hypothetical protein
MHAASFAADLAAVAVAAASRTILLVLHSNQQ